MKTRLSIARTMAATIGDHGTSTPMKPTRPSYYPRHRLFIY